MEIVLGIASFFVIALLIALALSDMLKQQGGE